MMGPMRGTARRCVRPARPFMNLAVQRMRGFRFLMSARLRREPEANWRPQV